MGRVRHVRRAGAEAAALRAGPARRASGAVLRSAPAPARAVGPHPQRAGRRRRASPRRDPGNAGRRRLRRREAPAHAAARRRAARLRLFANLGGNRFRERTSEAGVTGEVGGLNLAHADHDNDGDVDLLVLRGAWGGAQGRHPNSLLANRGDGTFTDVTEEADLLAFHPSQSGTWADYDGDRCLDLFVGNESGEGEVHPCQLFRNQGDGTFRDVAPEIGLDVVGFVKAAAWGDDDDDGRPDLYLSQLGEPNRLLRNEGPGEDGRWSFRDVTQGAGVAEPRDSLPTWFFDYPCPCQLPSPHPAVVVRA